MENEESLRTNQRRKMGPIQEEKKLKFGVESGLEKLFSISISPH